MFVSSNINLELAEDKSHTLRARENTTLCKTVILNEKIIFPKKQKYFYAPKVLYIRVLKGPIFRYCSSPAKNLNISRLHPRVSFQCLLRNVEHSFDKCDSFGKTIV